MNRRPPPPSSKPSQKTGPKTGPKVGETHQHRERRERFEKARRDSLRADSDDVVVLYGLHTVAAALRNPNRKIRKFLATENAARRLTDDGVTLRVQPQIVRPGDIDARLQPDAVHQGLYVEAEPLPSYEIAALPARGVVLVLDQITDPHNVGAIFRSASAFGVTAIVTTQRHSPDAHGALAKAATGALEHVPLVNVQNLARGLEELKARGFLLVGLDSEGDSDLALTPLKAPLALVMGAEGKGLRQLTRTTCDYLARIDLPGTIKSLNVSNATALALYIATTKTAAR
jgi:23S rRNA (guanosine2251-2'-O)-methyltransferase